MANSLLYRLFKICVAISSISISSFSFTISFILSLTIYFILSLAISSFSISLFTSFGFDILVYEKKIIFLISDYREIRRITRLRKIARERYMNHLYLMLLIFLILFHLIRGLGTNLISILPYVRLR